jgi:hypothetical protein
MTNCSKLILLFIALISVSCNIPDVSDIHLSSCIRECNEDSKVCFDESNDALLQCGDDTVCIANGIKQAQECLNVTLDCSADCIEETEAVLKN